MGIIHCCEMMDAGIKSNREILEYNSKMREYYALCRGDDGFILYYCPFCGKKLSDSLRNQWFDELSKILGFEVDISIDEKKIPKEFKSDAWWKKRNL